MDKYEIFEASKTIDFSQFAVKAEVLIKQYVYKARRERWLFFFKKPSKFVNEIGKLWGHIDSRRSLNVEILKLLSTEWIYVSYFDDKCYLLDTDQLECACLGVDGLTISSDGKDGKTAILFTHEYEDFLFKLGNR